MTAFVLVSGGYTGGWVWEELACRLRESGAAAYPATLTGMGDRRHLAGPETDLGTHIEDLVQLIDHVEAPEVVAVGHCYGIYPLLGAVGRRPERVARVVHLDSPMPRDGYSMLGQIRAEMADEATRGRMLQRAERAVDGWQVQPPTLEEWKRWGNVTGVPEEGVARLARLAGPQPIGTFTCPLEVTAAAEEVPLSGIFCTAHGAPGINVAQAAVDSGDPAFQRLADPRCGYFELATGHWPMLSEPELLARTLLAAAAGEGQRLTARLPAGA